MLAGRKLLLADDSITIQKVVALTFADEGIEVLAVSNGADAIEKLEEFWPDIVLADVYMPRVSGLQVCEHIKRSEKLRHIPVMLLVGSFEPFDEAEARRVGANDTLTKPFQSIRTLVEKVGLLLGREPAAENPEAVQRPAAPEMSETASRTHDPAPPETVAAAAVESVPPAVSQMTPELTGVSTLDGAETLEFPDRPALQIPNEKMNSGKLELTTADTKPLSPEIRAHLQQPANEEYATGTVVEHGKMATHVTADESSEASEAFGDTLLDLGDLESTPLLASDDVILDIDFDSPTSGAIYATPADSWPSTVEAPAGSAAVVGADGAWSGQAERLVEWEGEVHTSKPEWAAPPLLRAESVSRETEEFRGPQYLDYSGVVHPPATDAPAGVAPFTGQITLAQLSPEVIEAIARRAVELLSEKAVQEIAWEVVPQMAELLIKRKLEEK